MKRSMAKTVKIGDRIRTKARSLVRAEGQVTKIETGEHPYQPLFHIDAPEPGPFTYRMMVLVERANGN